MKNYLFGITLVKWFTTATVLCLIRTFHFVPTEKQLLEFAGRRTRKWNCNCARKTLVYVFGDFFLSNFIYPKFRVFLWNTPLDNNSLLLAIIRLEFCSKMLFKIYCEYFLFFLLSFLTTDFSIFLSSWLQFCSTTKLSVVIFSRIYLK